MRKDLNRQLKDIPAHPCDDPNLYPGYNKNIFREDIIKVYNVFFYVNKMNKANDVHMVRFDGKYHRVVRVSKVQHICYKAIELYLKESGQLTVTRTILETLYKEATIKSLIKQGLLFESIGGIIKLNRIG